MYVVSSCISDVLNDWREVDRRRAGLYHVGGVWGNGVVKNQIQLHHTEDTYLSGVWGNDVVLYLMQPHHIEDIYLQAVYVREACLGEIPIRFVGVWGNDAYVSPDFFPVRLPYTKNT